MNPMIVFNTQIRRDDAGRYCLNDLHQASGGQAKNKPGNWVMLKATRDLMDELSAEVAGPAGFPAGGAGIPAGPQTFSVGPPGFAGGAGACSEMSRGLAQVGAAPVSIVNDGYGNGTYVIKELVYAYAMWISPAFHLHVIRAYDAMVTGQAQAAAVPAVPMAATHRADVLVSAGRSFTALLRVGRTMGLSRTRSIAAANAAIHRATGIDLVDELAAHDVLIAPPERPVLADPLADRILDWLAGRSDASTMEVIVGAALGEPGDRALQMRVANALRAAGWQKYRDRISGWRWKEVDAE